MWFFDSPKIVHGEGALSYLTRLQGQRAFIVTDPNLRKLGFADRVAQALAQAGLKVRIYDDVEPEPSLETVRRGAQAMQEWRPDWVVGLGGGSALDAAKAMWVLYERPDIAPNAINPVEPLGLRKKARMVAIPTTSGTGSEATWAIVLTDTQAQRKLALGSRECTPDIAIVDPAFVLDLPPRLTADTGVDALTHAVEGYTSKWRNDFSDGLCLQAVRLIFRYLPRAYTDGKDREAREHMHNAATIAGLGFINSLTGLAHGLGHPLGAVFKVPHGRAVGLLLPYTIEFTATAVGERYADLAAAAGLGTVSAEEAGYRLAEAVRDLLQQLEQPTTLQALDIDAQALETHLPKLVADAEKDPETVTSPRIPDDTEIERLYRYALEGRRVDF